MKACNFPIRNKGTSHYFIPNMQAKHKLKSYAYID